MKRSFLLLWMLFVLLSSACTSFIFYELPALPFAIELPSTYGFLESDSTYLFSPKKGPATLVFEKRATDLAFFELFEGGYEELTPKSSGVWVICEKENWENCFVQSMDFPELYPLHIKSDGPLGAKGKEAVLESLNRLVKD